VENRPGARRFSSEIESHNAGREPCDEYFVVRIESHLRYNQGELLSLRDLFKYTNQGLEP
jgi:hypothetical protein